MSKISTTELNEENHGPEPKPVVTDNVPDTAPDRTLERRLPPGKPPMDGTLVDVRNTGKAPRKATGGRLAETLDRLLEPRVAPGKPGRPKGAPNYEWTPEMDRLLAEYAERYDLAKAKNVIAQRLMELCPRELMPRKDSLRNAVERRMAFLGLSTGNPRKKEPNLAECPKKAQKEVRSGTWTPHEITALLGTLGGDLISKSIVKRTHHSVQACYAKLRRLGHTVHELRSLAFTVDELAEMFQVTPRRVRTWKEKGWLKTTRRRVTGNDLQAFLKEHHGLIVFAVLPLKVRTFLLDLGYPAKEAPTFHANVKSILETIGGRKRRSDATSGGATHSARSAESPPMKRVFDKIWRWNQLKERRAGPHDSSWHYPRTSSLAFAAQTAGWN
jgi:hypothetical protein